MNNRNAVRNNEINYHTGLSSAHIERDMADWTIFRVTLDPVRYVHGIAHVDSVLLSIAREHGRAAHVSLLYKRIFIDGMPAYIAISDSTPDASGAALDSPEYVVYRPGIDDIETVAMDLRRMLSVEDARRLCDLLAGEGD